MPTTRLLLAFGGGEEVFGCRSPAEPTDGRPLRLAGVHRRLQLRRVRSDAGVAHFLARDVGSGKAGTPWVRMHWAQFNHACCWAGVSSWPVEFHGDGKALHAWRAPWNAAEFGSIPVVLYP